MVSHQNVAAHQVSSSSTKYPVPAAEAERLEALYQADILDTEREEDFDQIVRLARDLFDVPIAVVSFVDRHRQWFKSCLGLEVNETGRDVAFCTYAILEDGVMVVPDATRDDRFNSNPLVTGAPGIRFYAGAPLRTEDGHNLGTLCIIDEHPRAEFSAADRRRLANLAGMVMTVLRLRRQSVRLSDIDKAKTEFLSHMSHELRTPLNAIISMVGLLRQRKDLSAPVGGLVKTMSLAAESLLEIINSVLDLGAIEARSLTLAKERFSFDQLFEELISIMGARAAEKDLTLTIDYRALSGTYHEGDKLRLKQVLMNLLNNAIKFTEEGAVTLKARLLPSTDERACALIEFMVVDTGIGIPADQLDHVFKRYTQAHNASSRYESTGLGLAIVRELVEKMGGSVAVTSQLGFGSKFLVTVPYHAVAKPERPALSSAEPTRNCQTQAGSSYRLLLVEDYPPNVVVTQEFMRHFGYDCDVAIDGIEALQKVQAQFYDVVLMDINMPRLDGIGATRAIRALPELQDLPIIGMSAHVFEKERQACEDVGMDDYITKPIDASLLLQKIEQLLPRSAARLQRAAHGR